MAKRGVRISPRTAILDAAEDIMLEAGYSAVSSRRVAGRAGITSQLLHYYFRTMDDLFIAVFNRLEDKFDRHFVRAVASDHPIRQLWRLNMQAASTALILEFNALATHRKTIRALIARSARQDRTMHFAAVSRIAKRSKSRSMALPPMILTLLIASVARTLVTEKALGVSDGHAEMMAFVDRYLRRIEPLRTRKEATKRSARLPPRGGAPLRPGSRAPRALPGA